MAALPYGYQTLAGTGQVEQGTTRRQLAALRRQVEHIHQGRGATTTGRQGQAQGDEL
ncbi:hypothetical protein D3C81_2105750 [compost metagenome]